MILYKFVIGDHDILVFSHSLFSMLRMLDENKIKFSYAPVEHNVV